MTSISRREFTARSASVLAGALLPGARSTASRTAPRRASSCPATTWATRINR